MKRKSLLWEMPSTLLVQPVAIILAILATVTLFAISLLAPRAIDTALAAALFIPDQLGLVDHVTSEEIVELMGNGEHHVWLPRSGRYVVHSPQASGINTTVTLKAADSSFSMEVIPLPDPDQRTLSRTDDVSPSFIFQVESEGRYTISVSSEIDDVMLTIMPDLANQHATVAVLAGIVQIALLLIAAKLLYGYVYREQIQERRRAVDARRGEFENFLENELKKRS